MNASIPTSFVLADLFAVEAMSFDVPDHVLENDASFDWVSCPICEGEKLVLTTADTVCTCGRCFGMGEILDVVEVTASVPVVLREAA